MNTTSWRPRARAMALLLQLAVPVAFADDNAANNAVERDASGTATPVASGLAEQDAQTTTDPSSAHGAASAAPSGTESLGKVDVTATRLREARIELSPRVGTTIYSIDRQFIDNLSLGPDTPLNEVLLHFPGVYQDSKASGSLHVRDDHANVQYRINGIQLPEGISGFGQSIDTRFVDSIDFLTGALPAQYGLRTAGVVDIQTREGTLGTGGSIGMLGGGHETLQPSAELFGSRDGFSYYATGSYLSNTLGIENPTPSHEAIHDRTEQGKGFAYFSYIPNDTTRLALMLGTYTGRFQIPNNPGQTCQFSLAGVCDVDAGTNNLPSAQLDENQRESNHYVVLALQQRFDKLDYQAAVFAQYSRVHYTPDPNGGDLIYLGVASDSERVNRAAGVQVDAAYRYSDVHTIRFGAQLSQQRTQSNNTVGVFPTDDEGNPTSDQPMDIVDNSSKTGNYTSLYLQDEWHLNPVWTINYGVRYDKVNAFTDEQQWSPRLNTLWKITDATSLHAAYARYFTPPPQELVAQQSINLYANTTNAPEIPVSDNAKAERSHYFDVGITQTLSKNWTVGVDGYYKRDKNLLDEGQFGQALILTPFNYAHGYAEGVELSTTYSDPLWVAYANLGVARAKGKDIVSAQSLFGADELAYIADHYIYLDHDQRYSLSAGVTRRFGPTRLSADLIYGSGLRNTPDGAPPNSGKLPSYTQVNLAITHEWPKTAFGALEGRIALVNVFDESYLLRDGTGVGVGAPQYAERRTLYGGITIRF